MTGTRTFLFTLVLATAVPAAAEPMDVAMSGLAKKLLDGLAKSDKKDKVKSVAVMPLRELGKTAREKSLGPTLAEMLSAALVKDGRLKVIERSRMDAIIKEKKISATAGAAQDMDLGKLAGADALVVGELADAGNKVIATVRLLHIESGTTISADTANVDIQGGGSAAAEGPKVYAGGIESSSVDVALRRLADGLATGFAKLPGNARYRRLAVMDFTETGERSKGNELGALVTAELSTQLRRDHGLLLVERAKLKDVMKELALGETGIVDEKSAPQLGKLADAQALIMGSVADAGDRFLVNARVVATETGETLAADNAAIPAAGLIALSSDAVVLRSKSGAAFRSTILPGWGQFYNRQEIKGGAFLAIEAGIMGSALAFHLIGQSFETDYTTKNTREKLCGTRTNCDPVTEAETLRTSAQDRYQTRNLLVLIGAGFWVYNVLDAYISGYGGGEGAGGDVAVGPGGVVVSGRF